MRRKEEVQPKHDVLFAIDFMDTKELYRLLQTDPSLVNCRFQASGGLTEVTGLMYASRMGNLDAVNVFLSFPNIDVNKLAKDGIPAIFFAARAGRVAVVNRLLHVPGVILICPTTDVQWGYRGEHILELAAMRGHRGIVREIVKNAPRDKIDESSVNKAFNRAADAGDISTVRFLRDHPMLTDPAANAILDAIRHGYVDVVEELLKVPNIQINHQSREGETALHYAAASCHENILRKLLSHEAIDTTIVDKNGKTPLMKVGASHGAIELLISHCGSSINAKDSTGMTALHHAAHNRNFIGVLHLLTCDDLDVNATTHTGRTPLMLAFWTPQIFDELLNCRQVVDVNAQDQTGCTALHFAVHSGAQICVEKLLCKDHVNTEIRNHNGLLASQFTQPSSAEAIKRIFAKHIPQRRKRRLRVFLMGTLREPKNKSLVQFLPVDVLGLIAAAVQI
eukprot:c20195_g2_i2.p1 GENE.c20195_g2_i2~~c20195_g2_i2.p1  ORF type:complete len:451 (+),score=95.30 c20195_g2_i2:18-1370(+)